MGNIVRALLCGFMSVWALCSLDANDDVDVIAKRRPGENYVNDAVNSMISNPYSSPDYLLQQVYVVKGYAEQLYGIRMDLVKILRDVNREIEMFDKRRKIPDKHMSSLVSFIEKRSAMYDINKMCSDFDTPYHSDLNIANECVFEVPFKYYELDEIIYDVKHCQDIAQTVIDEVPPRLTFGVFLSIAGELLSKTPWGRAAKIAKEAGKVLIIESVAVSCEKENEKLKHNHNPEAERIRQVHDQVPFWQK